jgi:hypothetical protein
VDSVAYLRSAGRWSLYALHLVFQGRRASQKIPWLASTSGALLLCYSDFFLVELGNRDGRRAGNHFNRMALSCAQYRSRSGMSATGSDRRGVSELAGRSTVKKPGSSPGFCFVRPAGRTHLRVKVPYEPGRGNR